MQALRRLAIAVGALCAMACNAPEPPGSTGGTNQPPGACGRGLVVVNTQYQSTNVSLVGLDGTVLSPSFISSATADTKLSAKLTGDVVVPTMPASGDDIVLLDRYPASVLTWVDVKSGGVSRQLSVRTGFDANPHDYLELSSTKAYVSRYERNSQPGAEPFDAGDDLLIVDPSVPEITGSVSLAAAMQGVDPKFRATPHRMVLTSGSVIALLVGESSGHLDAAPSRLARVDPSTDAIEEVLVLDGLYECLSLALAPDGHRLALGCAGRFGGDSEPDPSEGGVVVVETSGTLQEVVRHPASVLGGAPGYGIGWASDSMLVATTFGGSGTESDRLVELDLVAGAARELAKAAPFQLSDALCACGTCYATDAEAGRLLRASVSSDGRVGSPTGMVVDDSIGLPPRWLGRF